MSSKFVLPDPIPPLKDPLYNDEFSPYAISGLREVVGTRINPDAIDWYRQREVLTNSGCLPKTAGHPDLEAWIAEVGGFDPRAALKQPKLADWEMSHIIPRVGLKTTGLVFPLSKGTYMIEYSALHSNPATLPTKEWVNNIKSFFPEGSRLLLSFFSDRELLYALWPKVDFWDCEFLKNFDGIICPDFTSYSNDPKPQTLLGERMHQVFAKEGFDNGHTTIPSIAWADEASLRRQADLWASQPDVNTVVLDCHGSGIHRAGWTWRWIFAMEKYFADKTDMRWIIIGIHAGWAIREFNRIFPNGNFCVVPTFSTYIAATRGQSDEDGMAAKFKRSIEKLEDFKLGNVVAEGQERPDEWPHFRNLLISNNS